MCSFQWLLLFLIFLCCFHFIGIISCRDVCAGEAVVQQVSDWFAGEYYFAGYTVGLKTLNIQVLLDKRNEKKLE